MGGGVDVSLRSDHRLFGCIGHLALLHWIELAGTYVQSQKKAGHLTCLFILIHNRVANHPNRVRLSRLIRRCQGLPASV